MSRQDRIRIILEKQFKPQSLEVVDESHLHAGHQPGYDGSGETHMRVRVISQAFAKMSRVERHRAVTDLLKTEFDTGLHALSVEARPPEAD